MSTLYGREGGGGGLATRPCDWARGPQGDEGGAGKERRGECGRERRWEVTVCH